MEVFFLSALLPPRDGDEPNFYDILGIDRYATDEELRKAYRKLSLKLHPDKIAQRGGDAAEKAEAAAEYELIQEAYDVLTDEKKRLKYDALGTPARYRFVERGGFADPQSLYENLTIASINDKSRLVGLFFIAVLLMLMQPILIAAKINQTLRVGGGGPLRMTSWFVILIPYWVMGALFIILIFGASAFVPARDRLPICLIGVEQFCWYLGIICLCYKWDGTWDDSVPYRQVLAPIYVAMLLRWSRSFLILHKVRKDVNRMVTSDYIDNELLKGRSMDELTEEEQKEITDAFFVVSVDPSFEPFTDELTHEELEEEKVEASPEYESATSIYNTTFNDLACSLVFGGIFLILLTNKLDDRLNGNWWAVFSPIWIERGGRLLLNIFKCCCGGVSGEEVLLSAEVDLPEDDGADGSDDKELKDDKNQQERSKTGLGPSDEIKTSDESQTNVSPEKNETNTEKEEKSENTIDNSNNEETNLASTKESSEYETVWATSTAGENDGADDGVERKDDVEKKEAPVVISPAGENVGDGVGGGDDDDDEIHIDEETYRAFQNAYNEAEKDAKQERAQSCTESWKIILELILLILVVAKIQKSFDSADPNDIGFNVFWILFPFFLFFGMILCCCTMLICGAEPDKPGDEIDEAEIDPENPPINSDANQDGVTVIPAIPTEDETAVEAVAAPEKQIDESMSDKSDPSKPPSDNNMDDLD